MTDEKKPEPMTPEQRDDVWRELATVLVDFMEGPDQATRARQLFDEIAGAPPYDVFPKSNRRGEQSTYYDAVARLVLAKLERAPEEAAVESVPDVGFNEDAANADGPAWASRKERS